MAENLKVKLRVEYIAFSDDADIVSKATALAATWKYAPKTLRDDELLITPASVNKNPIYSHESDAPEEQEITIGDPTAITGSFIGMTLDQLVELIGGTKDVTAYVMGDVLKVLNKALLIKFKNGGWVVYPRVQGYVQLDMNAGYNGRLKAPFDFTPLATTAAVTGIFETDPAAAVPTIEAVAARVASQSLTPVMETTSVATTAEEKTTTKK